MFTDMRKWATDQGAKMEVTGFGVTGYAGDVLERSLGADANIVETVAHMMSAKLVPAVDVICIGGAGHQGDVHAERRRQNFRLSNNKARQRHAAAGDSRSVRRASSPVRRRGGRSAPRAESSSCGCAVFLDSDRVNFQKEGYAKNCSRASRSMPSGGVRRPDPAHGQLGPRRFRAQGAARRRTWPRSRRRSTTSKRSERRGTISTRTAGETGAIGAMVRHCA